MSKQKEIELTNWAKASQEELKEDYQDFLLTRKLKEWPKTHRYAQRLSTLCRQPGATYADFQRGIESEDPEIAANVLLGLCKVTIYLLKRQIESLEKAFLKEGGIRERMTKARLEVRAKQQRDQKKIRD
jgi:four helix bundle suffix protein